VIDVANEQTIRRRYRAKGIFFFIDPRALKALNHHRVIDVLALIRVDPLATE